MIGVLARLIAAPVPAARRPLRRKVHGSNVIAS
jgi:hypothetical protein